MSKIYLDKIIVRKLYRDKDEININGMNLDNDKYNNTFI